MNNNPFNIIGQSQNKGRPYSEVKSDLNTTERIKEMIQSNDIFLFMKGTPDFPQCGFSANVISILNNFNSEFSTFDVLSDMEIRQGIKDFTNWPTIPQLYIKGEFIGGCDIITEMFNNGELEKVLSK